MYLGNICSLITIVIYIVNKNLPKYTHTYKPRCSSSRNIPNISKHVFPDKQQSHQSKTRMGKKGRGRRRGRRGRRRVKTEDGLCFRAKLTTRRKKRGNKFYLLSCTFKTHPRPSGRGRNRSASFVRVANRTFVTDSRDEALKESD